MALSGVKKGQGEMTLQMKWDFALALCLRMMVSENWHPLFGIMR
jgi:hypothetical protein